MESGTFLASIKNTSCSLHSRLDFCWIDFLLISDSTSYPMKLSTSKTSIMPPRISISVPTVRLRPRRILKNNRFYYPVFCTFMAVMHEKAVFVVIVKHDATCAKKLLGPQKRDILLADNTVFSCLKPHVFHDLLMFFKT